jgi:hypothetical protein
VSWTFVKLCHTYINVLEESMLNFHHSLCLKILYVFQIFHNSSHQINLAPFDIFLQHLIGMHGVLSGWKNATMRTAIISLIIQHMRGDYMFTSWMPVRYYGLLIFPRYTDGHLSLIFCYYFVCVYVILSLNFKGLIISILFYAWSTKKQTICWILNYIWFYQTCKE